MRQTFVVKRVFAFFLYLRLLSLSDLQDSSIPKPHDKLSTRGRESHYLRPRFVLPSAASSVTFGREQIICMASRGNDDRYVWRKGSYCGASIAPLIAAKHCSSLCSQSEGHDHVAKMLQVRYRSAISPLLCGVFAIIFVPLTLRAK